MSDRKVHARTASGTLIVRYDRAGKWYAEDGDKRRAITVSEAVDLAAQVGSYVYLGTPGGTTFDARVRRVASHLPEIKETDRG